VKVRNNSVDIWRRLVGLEFLCAHRALDEVNARRETHRIWTGYGKADPFGSQEDDSNLENSLVLGLTLPSTSQLRVIFAPFSRQYPDLPHPTPAIAKDLAPQAFIRVV